MVSWKSGPMQNVGQTLAMLPENACMAALSMVIRPKSCLKTSQSFAISVCSRSPFANTLDAFQASSIIVLAINCRRITKRPSTSSKIFNICHWMCRLCLNIYRSLCYSIEVYGWRHRSIDIVALKANAWKFPTYIFEYWFRENLNTLVFVTWNHIIPHIVQGWVEGRQNVSLLKKPCMQLLLKDTDSDSDAEYMYSDNIPTILRALL